MRTALVVVLAVFAAGCTKKKQATAGAAPSTAAPGDPARAPAAPTAPAADPAPVVGNPCQAACAHRQECGIADDGTCVDSCVSIGYPTDKVQDYVKSDCAAVEQAEPQFQEAAKCLSGCKHVLSCGVAGTLPGCMQLCASNLQNGSFDLAAVERITTSDCDTVKQTVTLEPAQAAPSASGGGGGTMDDCSRVGGSLVGGVCAQTFACRKLGCPAGWSCGVEGFCHHNQFPNCLRCP